MMASRPTPRSTTIAALIRWPELLLVFAIFTAKDILATVQGATVAASLSQFASSEPEPTGRNDAAESRTRRRRLSTDSNNDRIVGGESVEPGRYQYMAAVQRYDTAFSHTCGGSLIAPDVVLCAAHCADKDDEDKIPRYVQIKKHYRYEVNNEDDEDEVETYSIVNMTIHPQYDRSSAIWDVALIKLNGTSDERVVSLDKPSDAVDLEEGDELVVMGWGTTQVGGFLSMELLQAKVNVKSNEECIAAYDHYSNVSMLCAAALGRDACQGDSGGPLILSGTEDSGEGDIQVGIVSFGKGCADPRFPGVYARVSEAYEWIESTVCDLSDHGCLEGGVASTGSGGNSSAAPTVVPTKAPTTTAPTKGPTSPAPTDTSPTKEPTSEPSSMPSSNPSGTCALNETKVEVHLHTDGHAEETSWEIRDLHLSDVLAQSSSAAAGYENDTYYEETICLDGNVCYIFDMLDSNDDGICCSGRGGEGNYSLLVDDAVVAQGGEFASVESTVIGTCPQSSRHQEFITPLDGDISEAGNMFDLFTINDIVIVGFDIHTFLNNTAVEAEVYTKTGSHVGHEKNESDWMLIMGRRTVTGRGMGNPTPLGYLDVPVSLDAYSRQSFYVTTTENVQYSLGTNVGSIASGNDDFVLLEGTGNSYDFDVVFQPRIWNGVVRYSPATAASVSRVERDATPVHRRTSNDRKQKRMRTRVRGQG